MPRLPSRRLKPIRRVPRRPSKRASVSERKLRRATCVASVLARATGARGLADRIVSLHKKESHEVQNNYRLRIGSSRRLYLRRPSVSLSKRLGARRGPPHSGRWSLLLTLNEKGCYTGKTSVDGSPGAVPVKVVPGSPLVISYEQNACMMPATFTPQKDAHYLLIAEEGAKPSDPSSSFVGLLMHAPQRQCAVGVFELDGEGQPLKPVKVTAVRPRQTGLTCIKFR